MPTPHPCPKGHTSTDADFCSVCGTRIESSPSSSSPSTPSRSNTTIACPDCGTQHDRKDGKFCEICGHNFETGKSGEMPMTSGRSETIEALPIDIPPLYIPQIPGIDLPPPPPPAIQTPNQTPDQTPAWTITIAIDPTLAAPESPPPPTLAPYQIKIFPGIAQLIGRTNTARSITPEIALDFDNAISTRHAILACQPDGQLIIRDIGSSNGTQLNGTDLEPTKDYPLKSSDRLTLGHWTTLTLS